MSSQNPRPGKPQLPKVPEPPKPYKFSKASRDLYPKVFWLTGDSEKKLPNTTETDYVSDGQFACLCRPCTMWDAIAYENLYGETTDITIARAHWFMSIYYEQSIAAQQQNDEQLSAIAELLQKVETPKGHFYVTPYGPSMGLIQDMARIVGFLFSRGGRVVGQQGNGEYTTDDVTPDMVLQRLSPHDFMDSTDEEAGRLLWYTLIIHGNLWDDTVAKESTSDVDKEAIPQDDEMGNSVESSSEG